MSDTVFTHDSTAADSIEVNLTSTMSVALYSGGKAEAIAGTHSDREFESTSAELTQFVMGPTSDECQRGRGAIVMDQNW